MKKKYKNPFKMWGSYVGAVIGVVMLIIGTQLRQQPDWVYSIFAPIHIFSIQIASLGSDVFGYAIFMLGLGLIVNIILGFLIGWGIEVLLRKNKWFGLK